MRRIALFSDVHANLTALDAVLHDIARAGIQGRNVMCLGDLIGYGPDPSGVVARVREAGIATVRGNYDDGVGRRRGECGCYYVTEQAKADGAASYDFTAAAITERDRQWLAELPDSIRFEVGDIRVLLVHGSPRKINEYLLPDRTDEFLARLADEAVADVVCVGHVHLAYHRVVHGEGGRSIDYISVPSVGKPKDGDPRAGWTELLIDEGAGTVEAIVHRVDYDVESVAEAMLAAGLPSTLAEALRAG
jgi:predicted phosphodiesterase